ncbi:MAG: class I SAM-dependent methyltransferase [Chloroherpetonaceae bacterium]|nr:class I SAM-dependent methyltransferase [Chthonomonadaceae bacterium]MDW8206715.1 class I SAM-dependent methyltransferase [Chloroherpetonaceae bacterium]
MECALHGGSTHMPTLDVQRGPGASSNSRHFWDEWNRHRSPKYPHEKVIQFCFRHYPPEVRGQTRVLDLGCGSGTNTVFLAAEGFITTGVDLSPVGVASAQQKLQEAGLQACLQVADVGEELDFPSQSFHLILCVGVLECVDPETAARAVRSAHRLLCPGGRGLFLFASDRDFRVLSNPPLVHHGYTRAEVEQIFRLNFQQVWIDRYVTTYRGGQIEQYDWLVTLER